MKMIQKHSELNAENAKKLLLTSIKRAISQHTKYQLKLNTFVSKGFDKGSKERTLAKIEFITVKMFICESRVAQLVQTYKIMFHEVLDLSDIILAAGKKNYPLLHNNRINALKDKKSNDKSDDITEMIKDALKKQGLTEDDFIVKTAKVNTFGIKPEDFDNFEDFNKAVNEAKAKDGLDKLDTDLNKNSFKDTNSLLSKSKKNPGKLDT